MKEDLEDQNSPYDIEADTDPFPLRLSDDYGDEDVACESDSQNQFQGRWAAERWFLRVCFRRCQRYLASGLRPAKPTETTTDELPF